MSSFKSNLNPEFRSKFSEDIFNQKYRHEGAETWDALAKTLIDDVCGDLLSHCLLYTSPSPRDCRLSRMPSSA